MLSGKSFSSAWEELGGEVSLTVGYSATQPGFESEAHIDDAWRITTREPTEYLDGVRECSIFS